MKKTVYYELLVYGVIESTNHLRSFYVGDIHFKNLDQAQEQEIRIILIIFIDKNHFKKGKYGTL